MLEGRTVKDEFAVYFFPFYHGKNFVLKTKIKFISKTNANAQLLTRDSSKLNHESGMALFIKKGQVAVKHMVDRSNYVLIASSIDKKVELSKWYVMRFVIYGGGVKAFVDGIKVYDSGKSYPAGEYHEPHLAVFNGTVRFAYVKIYEPNGC